MREKLFLIGEDFWIENRAGERAFKVDGRALRLRDTLILQDPSGSELFKVQKKALYVRAQWASSVTATVRKARGNIVEHEYKVGSDGDHVAEVSKRWFRVRDTYGVEVAPGQDDALILAVVVRIDQMSHD